MFYDFITQNTDIFVEKMREAKASHIFFNKKYWHIWDTDVWNFNVSLTNDVVSFEQTSIIFAGRACIKNYENLQARIHKNYKNNRSCRPIHDYSQHSNSPGYIGLGYNLHHIESRQLKR